jgi:SulP family sulfate permease
VPSSKVIRALRKWSTDLQANGGRLLIAGVSPAAAKVLERGGVDDLLGPGGIVPATSRVFGALNEALDRGRRWIAERPGAPDGGTSDPRD